MKSKYLISAFLRGLSYNPQQRTRGGCAVKIQSIETLSAGADASSIETIDLPKDTAAMLNTELNKQETHRFHLFLDSLREQCTEKLSARTTRAIRIADLVYTLCWDTRETSKEVLPLSRDDVVRGKIALVTGGAQGFGRGITEKLLEHGCSVYLADIDTERAKKSAEELRQQYSSSMVYPVHVDCTQEQSVRRCAEHVAETSGGIDLLISNAGIITSGTVDILAVREFSNMSNVNYLGYFLLVKYFSPLMKYQFHGNKNYYSDIIQINSKSGLQGSKNNSAYAGSKFGGIGLTQSFALELVDYNVKVNAICPGNFYDGPMWSDPKTGLFVQYLETGKVPGAKTIDDVRKAYEEKTPMKRGCTIADVMRGILYLVEQTFETGQALPISGGQIMLH